MDLTPYHFTNYPISCVLQKYEAEIVAQNIMRILYRTGNQWRQLTYDEYEKERLIDGSFRKEEKEWFDQVKVYCDSPDRAKLFSSAWPGHEPPKTKPLVIT